MRKIAFALPALAVAVSGCAISPRQGVESPANMISSRPAAASVDVGVNWNWMVSGDNAVRPVQVFSLNGKTYLQMDARQLMPALIVNGTPVPFGISPPYLVIQGVPQRIDIVANGYRAIAAYMGPGKSSASIPQSPASAASAVSRVHRISMNSQGAYPQAVAQSYPVSAIQVNTLPPQQNTQPPASTKPDMIQQQGPLASAQQEVSRVQRVQVGQRDEIEWQIDPQQKTLSNALNQWAKRVGMRVEWRAPVDVPIVGRAQYRTIFLMAFNDALNDASGNGYRFVMALDGHKIIVTAVRNA